MNYDLSKKEKRICETCIDKALERELRAGLENFEAIILNWKNGKFPDDRQAYATLFNTVKDSEKDIFARYNSGKRFDPLTLVAVSYRDGYLNDEDIKEFSEETKTRIRVRGGRKYELVRRRRADITFDRESMSCQSLNAEHINR